MFCFFFLSFRHRILSCLLVLYVCCMYFFDVLKQVFFPPFLFFSGIGNVQALLVYQSFPPYCSVVVSLYLYFCVYEKNKVRVMSYEVSIKRRRCRTHAIDNQHMNMMNVIHVPITSLYLSAHNFSILRWSIKGIKLKLRSQARLCFR